MNQADICPTHPDSSTAKIPRHIAIIMDGNGRWAKQKGLPRQAGHKAGHLALKQAVKNCYTLGVKYLSVYTFSTENWNRPQPEVNFIMSFFSTMLKKEMKDLHQEGVKIKFIGHKPDLNPHIQELMEKAEKLTENNTNIQLNMMFNYGARNDILHAVKSILTAPPTNISDLTEEDISNALYTSGIPDPDILIRTSGEYRISNFLLWQIAYTEIFIINTLWPDFTKSHLESIIDEYHHRHRRFGGL